MNAEISKRAENTEAAGKSDRKTLIALGFVLVLTLVLFRPAQSWIAERAALGADTLDPNYFLELLRKSPRKERLIEVTWKTGKVPHQQAVLYLLRELGTNNVLEPAVFSKIVNEAIEGADLTGRELAMGILARRKDTNFVDAALRQLRDVDPQARLLGLEALRGEDPARVIPALMQTIGDADAIVAANSLLTLQRLSGHDFEFTARALAQNPKDPDAIKAMHEAVARARKWWEEQKKNYPASPNLAPTAPRPGAIVADFTLSDLAGNSVQLSSLRSKTVLLNFWTTWCTSCRSEFPALNELQNRRTNDLVILAISLDGANGESFKISGNSNELPDDSEKPATLPEIIKQVQRTAKVAGLKYKILLDPTADVGTRFNGGELPTNVLIDGEGHLRRRFVGPRSAEVFEAMLDEIKSGAAPK